MIKRINLGFTASYENAEPFLMADNDNIKMVFDTNNYSTLNSVIWVRNGKLKKCYSFQKEFEIPKEFYFSGYLLINVMTFSGEEKVKEWALPPLKIIETEATFLCTEILTDLENRVKALEKQHEIIL